MSRMLEEIRQQPSALERTLAAELRRIEKGKRREIDAKQTDTLKPGDNVYVKARRL